MAKQLHIDWSTAMHGLSQARVASPYLTNGRFNVGAIMREAIADARRIGRGLRLSWQQRLSVTLRAVWAKAHRAAVTARPVAA